MTRAEIRRLVRRGEWTAPRRGVLCVVAAPADLRDPRPHGRSPEIEATALALVRPESVISEDSAAALWGLPLLRRPARPSITMRGSDGGGQPAANAHAAALVESEIGRWLGVWLTRPARTVVDVARNFGVRAGLVAADAALHEGLTTRRALELEVRRETGWPGVRAARRVVELADPRAESPLESLTRLLAIDHGLPTPQLQVWIDTDRGAYRVDALWADRRVVLEADGMIKYGTSGELAREKLRQEALERAGYRVVRVLWDDVWRSPERTAARIRDALRLGGHIPLLVPGAHFGA